MPPADGRAHAAAAARAGGGLQQSLNIPGLTTCPRSASYTNTRIARRSRPALHSQHYFRRWLRSSLALKFHFRVERRRWCPGFRFRLPAHHFTRLHALGFFLVSSTMVRASCLRARRGAAAGGMRRAACRASCVPFLTLRFSACRLSCKCPRPRALAPHDSRVATCSAAQSSSSGQSERWCAGVQGTAGGRCSGHSRVQHGWLPAPCAPAGVRSLRRGARPSLPVCRYSGNRGARGGWGHPGWLQGRGSHGPLQEGRRQQRARGGGCALSCPALLVCKAWGSALALAAGARSAAARDSGSRRCTGPRGAALVRRRAAGLVCVLACLSWRTAAHGAVLSAALVTRAPLHHGKAAGAPPQAGDWRPVAGEEEEGGARVRW